MPIDPKPLTDPQPRDEDNAPPLSIGSVDALTCPRLQGVARIPRPAEKGDIVRFVSFGRIVTAVVVNRLEWMHCPAASTLTAYSPETTWLYMLSLLQGEYEIVARPATPEAAQRNVDDAHSQYRLHLMTSSPAWRRRIEANPDYRLF